MLLPTEFRIRRAFQKDAREVANLYLSSRKTFLPYAVLTHSDEEVYSWMADVLIPKQDVRVAVSGGRILGFMATHRKDETGWIDQLYIHPDALGNGTGSHLVEFAKKEIGPPIHLFTFQENTGGRRFYEHHGFLVLKYSNGSLNEEHCPDVLYAWNG